MLYTPPPPEKTLIIREGFFLPGITFNLFCCKFRLTALERAVMYNRGCVMKKKKSKELLEIEYFLCESILQKYGIELYEEPEIEVLARKVLKSAS